MEIVWSSLATEELLSILEYVESDFDIRVSQRVYEELTNHINLLADFPLLGIHDELYSTENIEVRYLINKQNIIYYLIYKKAVYVLSIANCNQSPERIQKNIADYLRHFK